jgi:hypothetical protein
VLNNDYETPCTKKEKGKEADHEGDDSKANIDKEVNASILESKIEKVVGT